MTRPKRWRQLLLLPLTAATLWAVSATAGAPTAADAARSLRERSALPELLLTREVGEWLAPSTSAPLLSLALRGAPVMPAPAEAPEEAPQETWSEELQRAPDAQRDDEDHEGTVLSEPGNTRAEITVTDNGVPARTLHPTDPAGYLVVGDVFLNNGSKSSVTAGQLAAPPAVPELSDAPQVLIVHTHATEAYTMPPGEEYVASDDHRTLDETCNMLRIGDEIASVLEEHGIGVIHDRGLYDYPDYNNAYTRSQEAVRRLMEEYPSLYYVLDVHRDAVEDAAGNEYKLLCREEPDAAQIEFVLGTDGGGAAHDNWRENCRLACAVQETLLARYPTLLRPIVLRNARYNQQLSPGALLVEIGAAGNSLEEALVAARLFADGFAETVLAG